MALQKIQRAPGTRGASQPPRSRAFFLELLLNMLIFALCAVVVVQVYAEGKLATDESAALTTLTLEAETLAETYKTTHGDLGVLAQSMSEREIPGEYSDKDTLAYYYDNDLKPSGAEDARYSLILTPSTGASDLVHVIVIAAYDGEDQLFSIEVAQYLPEEGR